MPDQTHLSDVRFDSFDLDPRILAGLEDAGFTHCTPIQAQTLPLALAGQDVAGQAQTGTGKTAAFLVAAMQHLLTNPLEPREGPAQPRVIVLAPTRELAVQIHRDAQTLGKHTGFKLGLVYGGTGYQEQRDEIAAGVDILIGTPGRFIDYYKQRVFDFESVQVMVLDEADRMFDLGFIKDIRFVLRRLPSPTQRLGMLFSATLSYRVTELAYEHMNDPQMVEIAPEQVTADRVQQTCYMVANDEKIPLLLGLVRSLEGGRIMVFINTKRVGEGVWGYLQGNGIETAMLSGDVPQKKRLKLLSQFTSGEISVMVATDVAARGLHIPGVSHVINYDLPDDAEDYVHRIGRTARAGEKGDAISFVCETYAFCLPDIETYIGMKIPVGEITSDMLAKVDPRSRIHVPRRPRDDRRDGPGQHRGERRGDGRGPGRGRPPGRGGNRGTGQGGSSDRDPGAASGAADNPNRADAPAQERPGPDAEQAKGGPTGNQAANQATQGDGQDNKPRRRRRRRKPAGDPAPAS